MAKTFHKTCNICEATCGLLVDVGDRGEVLRIRADADDPFSQGHICPKAIALREIQEDPDRLRFPLRRRGSDWQQVSWEEALELVASRIVELQARHGDDSVGTYLGNPAAHNFGTILVLTALNQAIATRNRYTASSTDQNPKHASSKLLFGNVFSIPIPDLDRTDFLLVLGANPVVSNGSLMTAPGFARRVRALHARGGRLVVIDPRRTETAALADEHWFLRPGRDGLLLAALVHVVLEEKLTRERHPFQHVAGLARLADWVSPFAPERVETALAIPAAKVRQLARDFAGAPSAACYGRVGTCQHPFGTLNSWLIDVLNLLTGNLDTPGGAMFPTPAVDLPGLARWRERGQEEPHWTTRVRGVPAFNGEQPVACLAEEILTPGEGQVRGMLTIAGNPCLSAPNGAALERAFASLEFCAAVDFYLNETTRHADVILPPTPSLEHDNYEVLFHGFAVRNTAKYSPQVLAPPAGTLDEWQILSDLALRILARKGSRGGRLAAGAARRLGLVPSPRRALDWLLRLGPYGDGFRPWRRGLRLADLEAHPAGIDLGALEPSLDRILTTPGGRIDLSPPVIGEELARLASSLQDGSAGPAPLLLIGRRDPRTNNSWLHNTPLSAKGRERCTLLMHPDDAARLHLADGARVVVRSRVGELTAPLQVSDEVMPGVVSLPHGWGHDRPDTRMRRAADRPGVNCNELVDDQVLEGVTGNAVYNGVPVEVRAAPAG